MSTVGINGDRVVDKGGCHPCSGETDHFTFDCALNLSLLIVLHWKLVSTFIEEVDSISYAL